MSTISSVPSYLEGFEGLYADDPHAAALEWFRQARFGLFIHYGLYSILGTGEWSLYHKKIPLEEYEKLADRFNPDGFDADFITDLACDAGMRYVNLVTCHHDGFCLWDSPSEPYNSARTAAGRDLVGELAEQCDRKKLGFFCYYTYALNWRHPYFFSREYSPMARPDYEVKPERYAFERPEDFRIYLDYAHNHIRELITGYGPPAGIWLDLISHYYQHPEFFPVEETYALIRSLQPGCLVAFKNGANGDEDFATPERSFESLARRLRPRFGDEIAARADVVWEKNRGKHNEICDTLQEHVWSYNRAEDGAHKSPDDVLEMLAYAAFKDCNLLLNTGPLPDGSIPAEDVKTLREVGRRIRRDGWPEPDDLPENRPDREQARRPAANGGVDGAAAQ